MHHVGHVGQTTLLALVLIEGVAELGMVEFIHFDADILLFHHLHLGFKAVRQLPGMLQGIGLPGGQQLLQQLPGTRRHNLSRLIEGIQLRGVLTEDLLRLGLRAII